MVSLALSVLGALKNNPKEQEGKMIIVTARLMLAQVELLLDKNKLDKNMFAPKLELARLNTTVQSVVSILSG